MSCFSQLSSAPNGTIPQILNATDSQNVTYMGEWLTEQAFRVSRTEGNTATILFAGEYW